MLLYETFYKRIVVFRKNQFFGPKFFPLADFELPRGALLHYIPTDPSEVGPENNDLLVNRYGDDIYVDHPIKVFTPLGNPIYKPISVQSLIKKYHNTHRRFKLMRSLKSVINNKRYMLIENYALGQHQIHYRTSLFTNYYRWYNLFYTTIHTAGKYQGESDRKQFIYLTLPSAIPMLQQLKIYEERLAKGLDKTLPGSGLEAFNDVLAQDPLYLLGYALEAFEAAYQDPSAVNFADCAALLSQATQGQASLTYNENPKRFLAEGLEVLGAFESRVVNFSPVLSLNVMNHFRTPNDYWFIHFWMWLGEFREASLFSMLDHHQLDKINLVFGNMGAYTVLNLGVLETWREETLEGASNLDSALDNFRKHFLKFFLKLFSVKTGGSDAEGEATVVEAAARSEGDDTFIGTNPETGELIATSEAEVKEPKSKTKTVYGLELPDIDDEPVEDIPQAKAPSKPALLPKAPRSATPETKDADKKGTVTENEVDEAERYETRTFADPLEDGDFNRDTETRRPRETMAVDGAPEPEDGVLAYLETLTDAGQLTAAEYKRFKELAVRYKVVENPVGDGTLEDLATIDPKTVADLGGLDAPDSISIIDKGMLKSSTKDFDKNYVKNLLEADVANAVLSIQNAGIAVIDYRREEHQDARNHYVVYSIQVQPVGGKVTTLHIRVPKIAEDGTMYVNGVKTRLRKQRADIPVRRINATTVSLTSYYGKIFMQRSALAVHNYPQWLCNRVIALSESLDSPVTKIVLGRSVDPRYKVPHLFAVLAQRFKEIDIGEFVFIFNRKDLLERFGEETFAHYQRSKLTVCGVYQDQPLLMDDSGIVYSVQDEGLTNQGDFEALIQLDVAKAPIETAVLGIFRKAVPVGVILSYYYGLSGMIEQLNLQVRVANRGERYQLSKDERAVVFSDEVLIFNRTDRLGAMLLNGFTFFAKELTRYSRYDFDRKSVFLGLLTTNGMSVRWIREFDLLRELFIDPITSQELKRINAPQTFDRLLTFAVKMLLNDNHLRETSFREQRVRGYERISGAIYLELVRAVRTQKARGATNKTGLDIHPDAVWYNVMSDTSSIPVEECNPIHSIKDTEIITYGGNGGRTGRSMTKPTREMIADNVGMISDATVDNADTGYTGYLSADPLLTDLRGNTQAATEDTDPTHIVSTTALLAPAADRDDPSRVSFISIQHSQGMYADGYQTTPYRTGEERLIAHRASKLYAYVAEEDGVVTEVTKKFLILQYAKRRVGVELGTRYGSASGTLYVHPIITDLAVGDTFKKGDVLVWNRNYFERDFMEPRQVSWKAGAMIRVMLVEEQFTYEDSSAITQETANRLATRTAKPIQLVVNFDQEVRNLLPIGSQVDSDTILCTLEDPVTAQLTGDDGTDALRLLANLNPKAKVNGEITKIDVIYKGSIEKMSESLAIITNRADRERGKLAKNLQDGSALTGEVLTPIRVNGTPLENNQAVIEVYVVVPMPTMSGDKGVYANQMKSTFGAIIPNSIRTESGKAINAKFSNKSFANRMATSPYVIGTVNLYLGTVTKKATGLYSRLKAQHHITFTE